MHDIIGLKMIIDAVKRLGVREISLHETEILVALQLLKTSALQIDRVIAIETVHAQHFAALRRRKSLAYMVADKAGRTGHEHFHYQRDR